MVFPATTDNLLFTCLGPKTLVSYSWTCKAAYNAVKSYEKRAFTVDTVLSPYFTPSEIEEFRTLQTSTGALISGSTALQFFLRNSTVYEGSDLDIYVDHRYVLPVVQFLMRTGYVFHPRENQHWLSLNVNLMSMTNLHIADQSDYESSIGVAGLYDMHRVRGGEERKVQLITTRDSPMDAVLNFHSTCVMQVISHSHAYSLYPRATFEEKLSLACSDHGRNGSRKDIARDKYAKRGWTVVSAHGAILHSPATAAGASGYNEPKLRSLFHMGTVRHLGDQLCWVIPLEPIRSSMDTSATATVFHLPRIEAAVGFRLLDTNSWKLDVPRSLTSSDHRSPFGEHLYCICTDRRLRHRYCVAPLMNVLKPIMGEGYYTHALEPRKIWGLELRLTNEKNIERWLEKNDSEVDIPPYIKYDLGFSGFVQDLVKSNLQTAPERRALTEDAE